MNDTKGFTLLELLIVIAVIGIVGGLAFVNGHRIAQRQEASGAIATFQQSVWQGATAAASRGSVVELNRTDDGLELVDLNRDRVLRRYELPSEVSIGAENPILRFLPPGKVDLSTLPDREKGLMVSTGQGDYRLKVSLIGEVMSEAQGAG